MLSTQETITFTQFATLQMLAGWLTTFLMAAMAIPKPVGALLHIVRVVILARGILFPQLLVFALVVGIHQQEQRHTH